MKKLLIILSLISIVCTGCGTIANHTVRETSEYGGTKFDYLQIYVNHNVIAISPAYYMFWTFFWTIDMPITAVGDTLMLPIDYFFWAGRPALISGEPMEPQVQ